MLSLEDYLIYQKKYFEETNKHLDENSFTWLSSKVTPSVMVSAGFGQGMHKLRVTARDPEFARDNMGSRLGITIS